MSSNASTELILEVERLLSLPAAARESEGIYANESQFKLLRKRIRADRDSQPAATGAVTEEGWSDSASVSFSGNGDVPRNNAIDVLGGPTEGAAKTKAQ